VRPIILIADDEEAIRDMLADLLRADLADTDPVFVALSSAEAVVEWVLEDSHVTAVVCDNNTGSRITGLQALRMLRENDRQVPFVLFTGDNLGSAILDGTAGCSEAICVQKCAPRSLDQIAQFVRAAIRDGRKPITADLGPYAAL